VTRRGNGAPRAGGADILLQPGSWDRLRLTWRLFRDPRVAPRLKMAVPALGALYLLSPIDLIPDLFVGLGQLDDLGILGLAFLLTTQILQRLAPPGVVAEHLAAMGLASPPRGGAAPTEQVVDAEFKVRD